MSAKTYQYAIDGVIAGDETPYRGHKVITGI